MKKPLTPEVLALIPEGIENFIPHCVVCTAELSGRRRKNSRRPYCSQPCHAVWMLYKKYLIYSSKCISCWHPSTPAERLLFREWRKAQGKLRRVKGRPKVEKLLVDPFADVPEPEASTFPQTAIDTTNSIS